MKRRLRGFADVILLQLTLISAILLTIAAFDAYVFNANSEASAIFDSRYFSAGVLVGLPPTLYKTMTGSVSKLRKRLSK